jgi:ABC-type polysaccharide/polyol phosphate transport system ATPase subunit
MNDASIILNDVSVAYPINHSKQLKDYFSGQALPSTHINALSNVNLTINKGERVGLIGLNGAGKSTLLKVMAHIYQPTQGVRKTRGHICPLFEFATGFEMEMTGWDNIRIRCMLLGMPKHEIKEKMREIADFTELDDVLNYPVRTYSAGMFIRLAFATSTAIDPEILLLDEVMGAGDASFTKKAEQRMLEFMQKGHILVFSTHSYALLESFCERTIWIHKGVVQADGSTKDVWAEYIKFLS